MQDQQHESRIRRARKRARRFALWMVAVTPALAVTMMLPQGCAAPRCAEVSALGNLGPEVNSPWDDYAPVPADSVTLLFTSNRIDPGKGGLQEELQTIRRAHLYFSMRLSITWDRSQRYRLLVEENGAEAATLTLATPSSPYNASAYMGACSRPDAVGGCDIYAVTIDAGIINLGSEINSEKFDGHPFVTADGTRLYFASDRPGGSGGTDIWICDRMANGYWSAPYNAGPPINSPADELAPFLDQATGRLYFAAANGDRGLDVFVIDSDTGKRRALPPPYNSEADDFTPFIAEGILYLASNRPGGCGGYDLYRFPLQ